MTTLTEKAYKLALACGSTEEEAKKFSISTITWTFFPKKENEWKDVFRVWLKQNKCSSHLDVYMKRICD